MTEKEKEIIEDLIKECEDRSINCYYESDRKLANESLRVLKKMKRLVEKQQEEIEELKRERDLNEEAEIALNSKIMDLENANKSKAIYINKQLKKISEVHNNWLKEIEELKKIRLIDTALIENSIGKEIVKKNYIPKSKIEEKIKILRDKQLKIYNEEGYTENYYHFTTVIDNYKEILE